MPLTPPLRRGSSFPPDTPALHERGSACGVLLGLYDTDNSSPEVLAS
ncbi:hypothetical protein IMZ48_25530 [Candidatus Bathyarchaeota archaeon]|nr:hypothetical protein [Candidatus Bathyarchaeota archaeon]